MTAETVCGYELLRELGARALPSYAALDPKARRPEERLCVVDRLVRGPGVGAEAAAEFLRDAKRIAQLRQPNVVRARDVVVAASTVLLVMDWIDGELLSEVGRLAAARGTRVPLATTLRILLDLLEGLSALHEMRDTKREPLRLVHAEVAPTNVLVGLDGRSVLVHPVRGPAHPTRQRPPELAAYLAPEVLLGDQTADQRADVYGAGVLLWEALTGHRMHPEGADGGEIVMRILGGRVPAPSAPPDHPWAGPLVEVARRATSPDPSVRHASATEMLSEVRRLTVSRAAPKTSVASFIEEIAGARVRQRRAALAAPPVPASPTLPDAPPPEASEGADALDVVIDVELSPEPAAVASSAAPSATETPRLPAFAAPEPSSRRVALLDPAEAALPPTSPAPVLPYPIHESESSKTDLGALALAAAPNVPMNGRALWTIGGATAVAVGVIVWALLRSSDAPRDAATGIVPVTSSSALQAGPARPEPPAAASEPSAARAESAPQARPAPPRNDVEPARTDDAEAQLRAAPARAAPRYEPEPTPAAAPPATPGPAGAPPPAASSPRPKKRVYDPQGI